MIFYLFTIFIIFLIIFFYKDTLKEKFKINKNNIYISLSTIPPRINNLENVLKSLQNQTIKVNKIFINIPISYKRFKKSNIVIPDFIKKMDNVVIYYIKKDYGPASKFIGSLINKDIRKNDYIVITDDDLIKDKYWLENLMKNHKNNRITSFVEKNLGKGIIWGYMGYIFKKKLINLNDILKFYSSVEEKCFFVDDHWFTGYCYYKKIPIYNIPIFNGKLINKIILENNNSLVDINNENNRRNVSEKCRELIYKKYGIKFPFWCCIGCCYPIPSNNILSISK